MGGWAGREEMDPRKEIRRQGGGELARETERPGRTRDSGLARLIEVDK